jgi:hypothetical protein
MNIGRTLTWRGPMRTAVKSLVVGLIVVVGGGLLIAGIVQMRRAADRAQCGDTLRVLGVALGHYHVAMGQFPQGTLHADPFKSSPTSHPLPPERRLSWCPSLEPYIYQYGGRLLEYADCPWDGPENCPLRILYNDDEHSETEPKDLREGVFEPRRSWQCPANPSREPPGMPTFTHYVAIAGVGEEAPHLEKYDPLAGVFGYDRRTKREDLQRGTGHTLLLMETASGNGPWTAGGPPTTRGLVPGPQPYLGPGGQFGGSHPGGGWAAFADGSARFLSESMSPAVLEDLATIRGGSPAGQD